MTQGLRMILPLLLLLSSQICPMHVGSRAMDCVSPEVRAYMEEERAKMKIVATTVTRRGSVYDWIDPRSQVPDGELAIPPPLDPEPDPLPLDDPNRPKQARGELENEPEARGPPGTVPLLRLNINHTCGLTVQEWLNRVNFHGGLGPENLSEGATPPP